MIDVLGSDDTHWQVSCAINLQHVYTFVFNRQMSSNIIVNTLFLISHTHNTIGTATTSHPPSFGSRTVSKHPQQNKPIGGTIHVMQTISRQLHLMHICNPLITTDMCFQTQSRQSIRGLLFTILSCQIDVLQVLNWIDKAVTTIRTLGRDAIHSKGIERDSYAILIFTRLY